MPHASNEELRQLTDSEAHDVLARAAALDARLPDTVSYDALWSSAEAAGISQAAFERATAELRGKTCSAWTHQYSHDRTAVCRPARDRCVPCLARVQNA